MCEGRGVLEVVSDDDRRQAQIFEELAKLGADAGSRVRVQRGERLVQEEHGGVAGQRAGQRDALALASRELADASPCEVGDSEAFEQRIDVRAISCTEAHVVNDVEVREQRVLLEEVADPSSFGCDVDALARCRGVSSRRGSRRRCCGRTSPATTRSTVVFPAPDGPTRARVSPCSTVRSALASKVRRGWVNWSRSAIWL